MTSEIKLERRHVDLSESSSFVIDAKSSSARVRARSSVGNKARIDAPIQEMWDIGVKRGSVRPRAPGCALVRGHSSGSTSCPGKQDFLF